MERGGNKIPCVFYFYFHSVLKDKAIGGIIPKKEARSWLYQWRIPNELRPIILKELEKLGLIKSMDKHIYKIEESNFDFSKTFQILEGLEE